jgi:hypothetical protein
VTLTTLAGPASYARCGRGDPSVQRDSEVEPYLAVSPTDPDRLIATWQQDRRIAAGAVGVAIAGSSDGGVTWHAERLPDGAPCGARGLTGASDPWLAIGPEGTAYLVDLPFAAPRRRRPTRAEVAVHRVPAALAGIAEPWSSPIRLSDGRRFDDKPSISADPRRPGVAWVVWHRGDRTLIRRTADQGVTWTAPRRVDALSATVGQVIYPLPDGRLLMTGLATGGRSAIVAAVSKDGGRTWGARVIIGARGPAFAHRPGGPAVRPGIFPAIAVLQDDTVVALWARAQRRGSEIVRTASRDGGRTWSPARVVLARRGDVMTPVVAAAADGALGLSWTEVAPRRRRERTLSTAVAFALSRDTGRTWRTRRLLGPFDLRRAPRAGRARFLGDYAGIAAVPGGFGILVAVAPPSARRGRSDVVFARVRVP